MTLPTADRPGSSQCDVRSDRPAPARPALAACAALPRFGAGQEEIIITKNGRPVSRLMPCRRQSQMSFGRSRDKIRILGNIVEPMPVEWFEDAEDPAGLLTDMHGDPADRLIVATALQGHQLATADRRILDWPGPLWCMNAAD